ncbi:RNA polymerase sigma factor [Candidatus Eisenbacteria bacterium]|uniref:RNA polymerase sigma factor n=1 Tax=Eiseniibacteriota bacterium TaxID=2212470 RepID=A0ABV6YK52_UNCEI
MRYHASIWLALGTAFLALAPGGTPGGSCMSCFLIQLECPDKVTRWTSYRESPEMAGLQESTMREPGSQARVSSPSPGASTDHTSDSPQPKWPERLKEFSRELQTLGEEPTRDGIREQVWSTLLSAFSLYLRIHASRLGRVSREDLEDLAAEKSLHLLRRIEAKKVNFSDPSLGEITNFISRTARNALLDLLREKARWVESPTGEQAEGNLPASITSFQPTETEPPDLQVERREFAGSLSACIERLKPRSRLIWFFRVFYGMASRDIAVHREIDLSVNHVDVVLKRARTTIRECVRQKGFEPREMPPGTFAELWKTFHLDRAQARGRIG